MSDSYDLIIVGGGIAGLTAATTAARLGMSTLVLTGALLGGHLVSIARIDGFPGHPEGIPGFDLCPATEEQASEAGATVLAEEVAALEAQGHEWVVTAESATHRARAVILATGTRLKSLGVPGERELTGKGVSHCASCDAPLLRGKQAVVIGGGDSALQEALTLAPVVGRLTVVTDMDRLTAQASYREQIAAARATDVRYNASVQEICGDSAVTGVRIKTPESEDTIAADGVFVFIGLAPAADLAAALSPELIDESGAIRTDVSLRTALSRLYAAGTVRAGSSFRAAAAAGDGAAAALTAFHDLSRD